MNTAIAVAIREWLKSRAYPCTQEAIEAARAACPHVVVGADPGAIAAGLGMESQAERMPVYWSLGVMFRLGILGREGVGRGFRYYVARDPVIVRLTKEEKRLRRNARLRAARVARGGLTREEAQRLQQERNAERLAARRKAAAEREAEREARRQAVRARERKLRADAPKAPPKPKPPEKPKPPAQKQAPGRAQQVAAPARPETVAEFLARGGRVDRIPPVWEGVA